MSRWGPATVQQVTQDTGADEREKAKVSPSTWACLHPSKRHCVRPIDS